MTTTDIIRIVTTTEIILISGTAGLGGTIPIPTEIEAGEEDVTHIHPDLENSTAVAIIGITIRPTKEKTTKARKLQEARAKKHPRMSRYLAKII